MQYPNPVKYSTYPEGLLRSKSLEKKIKKRPLNLAVISNFVTLGESDFRNMTWKTVIGC